MHMSSQVVGLFDTLDAAQGAVRELRGQGISNAELRVVANPGRSLADITDVDTAASAEGRTANAQVMGDAVVLVRVNDSELDQVVDLMRRHNAVDINDRADEFTVEGWSLYEDEASAAN